MHAVVHFCSAFSTSSPWHPGFIEREASVTARSPRWNLIRIHAHSVTKAESWHASRVWWKNIHTHTIPAHAIRSLDLGHRMPSDPIYRTASHAFPIAIWNLKNSNAHNIQTTNTRILDFIQLCRASSARSVYRNPRAFRSDTAAGHPRGLRRCAALLYPGHPAGDEAEEQSTGRPPSAWWSAAKEVNRAQFRGAVRSGRPQPRRRANQQRSV